MRARRLATGITLLALTGVAAADERADLEKLRATVTGLIGALVEQGVLSREAADGMIKKAEADAARTVAAQAQQAPPARPGEVRVTYVPQIVKDEIRAQVRDELRQEVAQDVIDRARQEQWGVPAALPDWVARLKFKGDLRLRGQSDRFADGNAQFAYFDFLEINNAGGLADAGADGLLNTSEDRDRLRARARLGLDVTITDSLLAGFRLGTGNTRDPVSTNQTLGNTGNRYETVLDQAFLRYQAAGATPWLTAWGGRFDSPWLSTDLVWDGDLGFEGAAATLRHDFVGSGQPARGVFLTAGAFPLQEEELSSKDKWLFGGQLGLDLAFADQSRLKAGLAYYHFSHVVGRRNDLDGIEFDYTAPEYLQKGNTLYDIRNDADPQSQLFALASDYHLLDLTVQYDIARFAPYHVILTGDFVRNVGFDEDEVAARIGQPIEAKINGYQFMASVGWPQVTAAGRWRVFGGYKHLERDAVLDAFTDSDFHLGGTDAKGWILGGDYGLARNTWLTMRYLSADEIDGPPLGIDVLQLDLNTRF
ncbi:hypothetical protein PG2T_13980 [Immundisolibacter cernigliae]|uniref:Outer membrane receptor for ferric coprogen and ferric-rhodotorulic acid n=1 Tax=Immundisolibacter cernigliae TaxID=1810504 RepID=A0A1B1YY08_9GAMM|nr:hypothetical protein PG2T_13980 [Immundisolibacter cernigliae]